MRVALPLATSAFSCLWLYVQHCCSAELKRHRKNETGSLIRVLLKTELLFLTFDTNMILKKSDIIRNLLEWCFLTVDTLLILCQLGPNVHH